MSVPTVEVPGRSWNRREFLIAGSAAVAVWPMLAGARSAVAQKCVMLPGYPYTLGVASGDPWPDGFVIWTRLAPKPLEGGGMPAQNVLVDWQVADDEAMTKVVAKGTAVASRELAHAVHVEVQGLEPGRWYWYQFYAAGEVSPKGPDLLLNRQIQFWRLANFAILDSRQYRTDQPCGDETTVVPSLRRRDGFSPLRRVRSQRAELRGRV